MTPREFLRPSWTAVVPIRDFHTGKSRLRGYLPDRIVNQVARQLAKRTIAELQDCRAIRRILVVSDVDLSEGLVEEGVDHLVQRPGGRLNAAVREGLIAARAHRMDSPILVTHADLPYVTGSEYTNLIRKLNAIGEDTYVPDRTGTGTTMLALHPGSTRCPSFGSGSGPRHEEHGFRRIELSQDSGLRNDLDTITDYYQVMNSPTSINQGSTTYFVD